jgi:thiol:disulfide interchange protein DsbA
MIKRILASCIMALSLWGSSVAFAADFEEGVNYIRLGTPLPTLHKDKIEVVEFFWYGCVHCYHFEPTLEAWAAQQDDDVYVVGSPAMWNKTMQIHAQAYYTAQALKVLDKVNAPLFAALNTQPRPKLDSEDELAAFFAQHGGVAEADFRKAFNSFGVSSLVRQADARARSTQIEGTPELLVNGKYRVSAALAGGQNQMLQVAGYLIAKERAAASKE